MVLARCAVYQIDPSGATAGSCGYAGLLGVILQMTNPELGQQAQEAQSQLSTAGRGEHDQGERFHAHNNVLQMKRIVIPAALILIGLPLAASAFKEGPYPNVTGGFGEQS